MAANGSHDITDGVTQDADAVPNNPDVGGETGGFISSHNKIRVLQGASDTAASFEFEEEDHTMGNALRYIIMKNPEVELCGYSIPHPSEPKMNLRIQTYDGANVYEVLEKGLKDLVDLCNVITEKFTEARDAFDGDKMAQ